MELLRPHIPHLTPHDRLAALTPREARRVSVCGLVITRQRPGTASGVIFLTLEDETGVSNVVVWPKMYEKFRPAVLGGRLLKVTGRLEREGMVVHLIADHIEDRSRDLSLLGHPNDDVLGQTTTKTDDVPVHLKSDAQRTRAMHPREQAKRLFPSRDFH
jgi:error-prone DNA polymerase